MEYNMQLTRPLPTELGAIIRAGDGDLYTLTRFGVVRPVVFWTQVKDNGIRLDIQEIEELGTWALVREGLTDEELARLTDEELT